MATRKDAPYTPTTSLSRTGGRKLTAVDNASHELLMSHPLLSPPPAVVTTAAQAQDAKTSESPTTVNTSASPKYVPYTPRHRVTTSQVTSQASSFTASSSSLPIGTGGGATPQLQLQNLKAAAQNAHLAVGSVGWAICEKLYNEGENPEWEDLWSAVINNKVRIHCSCVSIEVMWFVGYDATPDGSAIASRGDHARLCQRPCRILYSSIQ
jgi:hypothetical protein